MVFLKKSVKLLSFGALFALTACAAEHVITTELEARPDVNIVQSPVGDYVGAVKIRQPFTAISAEQKQFCLSKNMIPLFLPFNELRKYQPSKQLAFSIPDNEPETLVARGHMIVANKDVSYRLESQTIGNDNYFYVNQLGYAGLNQDKPHYHSIAAWRYGFAPQVVDTVSHLVSKIQQCYVTESEQNFK